MTDIIDQLERELLLTRQRAESLAHDHATAVAERDEALERIKALEGGIVAENRRTSAVERELQTVRRELQAAENVLIGRDEDWHPDGFVPLATVIERVLHERDEARKRHTEVQARCTELLEEKRRANVDYAVREFHLKFGHAAPGRLSIPNDAVVRFRLQLIAEEFFELVEASVPAWQSRPWTFVDARERVERHIMNADVRLDLPAFMDATHDLDYVVAGTRVTFGYNGLPGAAEVHRANMDKEPVGPLGKPTKPEGWRPPDIEGVLRAQGWGQDRRAGAANAHAAREGAPFAPPTNVKLDMLSNEPLCQDGLLHDWGNMSTGEEQLAIWCECSKCGKRSALRYHTAGAQVLGQGQKP